MTNIFAFFYIFVALIYYNASIAIATNDLDQRLKPNDPEVVEHAKYAVDFINKVRPDEPKIEYVKVFWAIKRKPNPNAKPCPSGTSYTLKISTKIKNSTAKRRRSFWATVHEDEMMLKSFEEIKNPSKMTQILRVTVWRPMDSNDPIAIETGKFAVAKHNKNANTTLEFIAVVQAKERGHCLPMSQRVLVISAKNSTSHGNYKANVWVQSPRILWRDMDL